MSLTQRSSQTGDPSTFIPEAVESLVAQSKALTAVAQYLGAELDDAVKLVLGCKGRVLVIGMGKSSHVGKKIAASFASTGTPSFYVHPGEAIHGDLSMVTADDLIVMISNSGDSDDVVTLMPSLKYFGNRIIGIVGNSDSILGAEADVVLQLGIDREDCSDALLPAATSLAMMALGDALAACLVKARDFKPTDFEQFHPGGMLGRRMMSRVGDVMSTEDLPFVSPTDTIRDAVFCMTSGRLGLAIVVDGKQLQGILTDGDLRRALIMDPGMMDKSVQEFMTPVPVTISANSMVSDAENLMRKYKIRALIVTDAREDGDDTVCGLLEIFAES